MIGAITMPRSWSLRRTGTITTIDLLLVNTRKQRTRPKRPGSLLFEKPAFPSAIPGIKREPTRNSYRASAFSFYLL
jgi:hypothetical protein